MIIDVNHPDALRINVYGKDGKKLGLVQSVDTDTMTGIQLTLRIDSKTGNLISQTIPIYKIVGPGIYFLRGKRTLNSKGKNEKKN